MSQRSWGQHGVICVAATDAKCTIRKFWDLGTETICLICRLIKDFLLRLLAHIAIVFTLNISCTFHWIGWRISVGWVNSLLIFSAEGESSNHAGASETQPSGEFCGDSKLFFFTYNATLYLTKNGIFLHFFIYLVCSHHPKKHSSSDHGGGHHVSLGTIC